MRTKLGIKSSQNEETAVIICDMHPFSVGVVVDSVNSVFSIKESEIQPKPELEASKKTDFVTGVAKVEDKLVLLLDAARLLNLEDQQAIKKAVNG